MPVETKDLEASLASVLRELEHLKDGLRLLGLKQCSACGTYFLCQDGKALFDAGELACYACLTPWWRRYSPGLSIEQRQALEGKLLRWLVAHHDAKVIRHAEKLPPSDAIELKVVVACDQCDGTGKNEGGRECHNCEGRGSVWVVTLRPELQ